jgi:proline iminopeptidase
MMKRSTHPLSTPSRGGAQSIQRPGATLRYTVEGSGTPVLVLGSAVFYPRTFSRELRDRCTLAFADLRHFAVAGPGSGSSPDEVGLGTYLEDIDRLRAAIGFDESVVLGHSHHGCLALEYAKRYPERASHVVMIASPPVSVESTIAAGASYWARHATQERRETLQRNRRALASHRLADADSAEAFVARYVADGPRYWYDTDYDASWLWDGVPMEIEAISSFRRLFTDYQVRWDPTRLGAPVLVVTGRHDYVVPPTLWEEVIPDLPKLTYQRFEESGHTPQLEEPERFDEVLLRWLSDTPAPGTRAPKTHAPGRPSKGSSP